MMRGIILLVTLLLTGCTGAPQGLEPVRGFDLERYLGTWYEIARLDHPFERGLSDITATYSRRGDGGLDVLNRGWDMEKGAWRQARGRGYFLDTPQVASLKVSFFGPFYGGYHVFALDPNYQWALVSGPSRAYLWILARTPLLPEPLLLELTDKARRAGFDTDALIYPTHGRQEGTP